MFGAEAFPKINTGTSLVVSSGNMLANTGGSATVQQMSPMDTIREVFFDIRDSLQQIVENTLQTNELLKVGVLGTPAEQRDESIERGETDTDVPKPEEDSGPSFLDRLKGLNPFQGGIGTFGKVLLALAGLLGLKLFGPQIQGGLANLLTAIADGNLGEKIEEITELIKTKTVGAFEKLKTGTASFLENIQYISDFIGALAKNTNEYFMQFDTQGAGPGGMNPDGKLDEFEMKALTDDITSRISTSIFGFLDGIVGTIISGLTLYAIGTRALGLLLTTGATTAGASAFLAGGVFSMAAAAVVIAAGIFKLGDNIMTAFNDAVTDELGNEQDFNMKEFVTRLLVGRETGNKLRDVLKNAADKAIIGGSLGFVVGGPLGAAIGALAGGIVGGFATYVGSEETAKFIESAFGENSIIGMTVNYLVDVYKKLILDPFEFLFGKLGVENDSLLARLGYQFDREGPMTKQDLYPDAFNLENKTTEQLLEQKNEAMVELSQQPQLKSIFGFYPFGKYRDDHTVRDLELQIDNIDRILQSRGSSDVNSQSNLPFLQMGSIEPKLEPLMRDVFTLREAAQRDMLVKDLDNMIIGSGNTTTSNVSNVNNFPGGFSPNNDFITAVIMGDKRAKMN